MIFQSEAAECGLVCVGGCSIFCVSQSPWPSAGLNRMKSDSRKASLFANTRTGASASATLYSKVETEKVNGLDPYKYLSELFEKLPTTNTPEALAKLLPY